MQYKGNAEHVACFPLRNVVLLEGWPYIGSLMRPGKPSFPVIRNYIGVTGHLVLLSRLMVQ